MCLVWIWQNKRKCEGDKWFIKILKVQRPSDLFICGWKLFSTFSPAPSLQHHLGTLALVWEHLQPSNFKYQYVFPVVILSGLWLGHSSTSAHFGFNQSSVALSLCWGLCLSPWAAFLSRLRKSVPTSWCCLTVGMELPGWWFSTSRCVLETKKLRLGLTSSKRLLLHIVFYVF